MNDLLASREERLASFRSQKPTEFSINCWIVILTKLLYHPCTVVATGTSVHISHDGQHSNLLNQMSALVNAKTKTIIVQLPLDHQQYRQSQCMCSSALSQLSRAAFIIRASSFATTALLWNSSRTRYDVNPQAAPARNCHALNTWSPTPQ
jgi:hypothetical protein